MAGRRDKVRMMVAVAVACFCIFGAVGFAMLDQALFATIAVVVALIVGLAAIKLT